MALIMVYLRPTYNNNNKYLFHNIKLHSLNYKKENITIEVQVHIHNEIFLSSRFSTNAILAFNADISLFNTLYTL